MLAKIDSYYTKLNHFKHISARSGQSPKSTCATQTIMLYKHQCPTNAREVHLVTDRETVNEINNLSAKTDNHTADN